MIAMTPWSQNNVRGIVDLPTEIFLMIYHLLEQADIIQLSGKHNFHVYYLTLASRIGIFLASDLWTPTFVKKIFKQNFFSILDNKINLTPMFFLYI